MVTMAALFTQTDACHYCSEVPLRHHIMPLLFRLLYGCVLRISEALNLRLEDINLHDGVLTVILDCYSECAATPFSHNRHLFAELDKWIRVLRCMKYNRKWKTDNRRFRLKHFRNRGLVGNS